MIFEKKQIKKLVSKLKEIEKPYLGLMFEEIEDLDVVSYMTKEHLRNTPQNVEWAPIEKGQKWGGGFQNMWLKTSFEVPQEFAGRKIILNSSLDAFEWMVFVGDRPMGLFNKDGDVHGANHSVALLSKEAKSGESFDISLECYAGTPCLMYDAYENYGLDEMPEEKYIRTFNGVTACAIRDDVVKFLFDLKTLNQLIECTDQSSFRYGELLEAGMNVYKEICQDPLVVDEDVWRISVKKANMAMEEVLSAKNSSSQGKVGLIGHAHLDSAWLWTVEETKRKSARTFSNALSLMDWYPEYTFIQSSALHIAWMKEYYPSVFEEMKKRIAEGRYEPNGAVWVECDCNITGGEAMIRQFLFGQRYTMQEFGYKSDTFWLPDTFGYYSAIPQIIKGF
jgi:alpha-mannosidase